MITSKQLAGLTIYTVDVEFPSDSDSNIWVVAGDVEEAVKKAKKLFAEPTRPMLKNHDNDTWRNAEIGKVEYTGEIDG